MRYNEKHILFERLFLVNKKFLLGFLSFVLVTALSWGLFHHYRTPENDTILLGASLPLSGINSHLG